MVQELAMMREKDVQKPYFGIIKDNMMSMLR